jgi:hypothetical protein
MKQTEAALKIKRNIQEAAQRRWQTKINKMQWEMQKQELDTMLTRSRVEANFIFGMGRRSEVV